MIHDEDRGPISVTVAGMPRYGRVPEWLWNAPISDAALRVYVVIHGKYGHYEQAIPKLSTLAEDTGKSRRTLMRLIAELEAVGAMRRESRYRPDGGQSSSSYILAFAEPFEGVSSMTPPPVPEPTPPPVPNVAPQEVDPSKGFRQTRNNNKHTRASSADGPAAAGRPSVADAPASDDGAERFPEFWAAWPRKVGKAPALRAWASAVRRGADPGAVIDRAREQVGIWREARQDARFIPHAATWLNQSRYADDEPDRPTPDRRVHVAYQDPIDPATAYHDRLI